MENRNISYLWVIPIILIIPVIQNAVYYARFSRMPENVIAESYVFIPAGLISGIFLIYLLRLGEDNSRRRRTVVGFGAGLPFAIFFMIVGGLIFPPLIAILFLGSIPLMLGSYIGYRGRRK